MIILSQTESNLLYFCKCHYSHDFWDGISKIYMEEYDMYEPDFQGIFYMIQKLWFKLFAERGFNEDFLNAYERDSIPSENWKVWGGLNSDKKRPWTEPNSWTSLDFLKAKITSMVSQIHLSEIKYFDAMEPESEYAGMKLQNSDYFKKKIDSAD